MQPEQEIAEIFRVLYRLKLLNYNDLDKLCDELQLRLFERQYASKGSQVS